MSFSILLIIYFLLFTFLAYRRLDWSIYLIIFASLSYLIRFQVLGVPMTLLEGMILILFFVWLFKIFLILDSRFLILNNLKGLLKDNKGLYWALGLFLLAATVSVFTAPELRASAGIWKAYFIEPILFFIVFISVITPLSGVTTTLGVVKSKKQIKNVIWVLGLSILIPGLIAIYQKFTGAFIPELFWQAENTRRVTSIYGYPNAIGLYFAPIVALLLGIFIIKLKNIFASRHAELVSASKTLKQVQGDNKNWLRVILIGVLIIIGLLSIIFAVSKGAILAIAIGILFYAIFWKGYRKTFAGLLILLILIGLISPYLIGGLTNKLFTLEGTKTVTGGGSLEVRLEQWGEAWQMLKTRPIFGAGLSGFQQRVTPYHTKDYIEIFLYPHNIILNFWSEIGLLGLIAFVWIVVLFYRRGFSCHSGAERSRAIESQDPIGLANSVSRMTLPIMAAMTTLLAHGLVDAPYFKNDLSVLFWVLFGLIVVIFQLKKETPSLG